MPAYRRPEGATTSNGLVPEPRLPLQPVPRDLMTEEAPEPGQPAQKGDRPLAARALRQEADDRRQQLPWPGKISLGCVKKKSAAARFGPGAPAPGCPEGQHSQSHVQSGLGSAAKPLGGAPG
eukprot:9493131-Pyramimonas_sp.AAC.1